MTHDQSPISPVVELGTAECWRLLESQRVARLALVDAAGEPRIYPVNFSSRDGALYLRSAHDAKMRFLRSRPVVALEVDGQDGGDRWSVVVRGEAAAVERDAEIRHSRETGLRSMSPTPKPYVIRISPRSVTGRRFAERVEGAEADPLRSRIFRPREGTLPAAARAPHPIAGITPMRDA